VRLSTRRGLAVLGVYLFTQALVQTLVGVVVGTRLALATQGTADATALATAIQSLGGPGSCVAGAIAGLAVLRAMPRDHAIDTPGALSSPGYAVETFQPATEIAFTMWAFVSGALLALCYIIAAIAMYPPEASSSAGPFASMAGTPGVHRFLWAAFAVTCAPAIEEVVFRGAVFTALERVWGALWGGIVVTSAFVALHASELGAYPPAMIAVTLLSLLALGLRIRSGGVAAAIAAHTGYNLVIVTNSFLA
jgi:membrane protease YdiL (CAAX protease family)